MVRLIENTVKGFLQLPLNVADGNPAVDLLRRVLVPNPKNRYKMSDIIRHPWFQTNLPEGALDLNQSCLPINHDAARQSPETLRNMVAACLQSVGPEGNLQPLLVDVPEDWLDDDSM